MPERSEILDLLLEKPADDLRQQAEKATLAQKGGHVFVRGLLEFSNRCKRNCLYCGLRAQNSAIRRYLLPQEAIIASAEMAVAAGADTIVLQSGEGCFNAGWLAEIVREITTRLRVPVTLSVGECESGAYELWRKAGAARYLLRHETSDAALYARLHPGHSLENRLKCLRILGSLGYEVGSGFMVGLPGQSMESIADDILLCRKLNVDMAGIGPFIPQSGTPLAGQKGGSADLALRAIAALRIAHPRVNQPATTALASLDPAQGQTEGLRWGANVLMASFTPPAAAKDYTIYDNKCRVSMQDAARAIEDAGRTHGLVTSLPA